MKKISFVLPCFNVERYIADCLDSIYVQDMPENEYEVICINDCSTDGTRSAIVDYSQRHSNLTLIDHVENLTAGGARNSGIKEAKGEYIWFVDPDDMIEPNCLLELFSAATSKSVDVLMYNFRVVDEQLNPIQNRDVCFRESDVLTGQDFVTKYTPGGFSKHCLVWRCLFSSAFLKERALYYPIMRKAQDVSFLWKVLLNAEKVASIEDSCYIYRRNPNSVVNFRSNAGVFFSERILFGNEIAVMLNDCCVEIQSLLKEDMLKTLSWCANSNSDTLFSMSKQELGKYYGEIKANYKAVNRVKKYMNAQSRLLYCTFGGKGIWLLKVCLLKSVFRKKEKK